MAYNIHEVSFDNLRVHPECIKRDIGGTGVQNNFRDLLALVESIHTSGMDKPLLVVDGPYPLIVGGVKRYAAICLIKHLYPDRFYQLFKRGQVQCYLADEANQ